MAIQKALHEQVKIAMTYEHYLALQMIDVHDFTHVKKKVAQDHSITDHDYLDLGILYLKRYYAIHILDPLNPPAMSKPIDLWWSSYFGHINRWVELPIYARKHWVTSCPVWSAAARSCRS